MQDLVDFTKKTLQDMQKKIAFFKERCEKLETLQGRNTELEKQLIRLKAECNVQIERAKSQVQEKYERKLEKAEADFQKALHELTEKHAIKLNQKLAEYTKLISATPPTEHYEKLIESLKSEKMVCKAFIECSKPHFFSFGNKIIMKIVEDLKAKVVDLEKINYYNQEQMLRLKQQNNDLKMKLGDIFPEIEDINCL